MYSSTRGIVFRQTRYSDTSLVVRIFTEELGLRSYLVKGALRPKSKLKASLFQPLTLLELIVSDNEKGELHHIREARIAHAYYSLPGNIHKSSILLFLNELLYKSIREEATNREMFGFIYNQLLFLDHTEKVSGSYPLLFALHLSRYLGFFPQGNAGDPGAVFDLEEGCFSRSPERSEYTISGEPCTYFTKLLHLSPETHLAITLPAPVRQVLLEKILQYYTFHLPISGEFKSHIVLHEVLRK